LFNLRREGFQGEGRLCEKPLPLVCLLVTFLHKQKSDPPEAIPAAV
jgi:hypothetical protein